MLHQRLMSRQILSSLQTLQLRRQRRNPRPENIIPSTSIIHDSPLPSTITFAAYLVLTNLPTDRYRPTIFTDDLLCLPLRRPLPVGRRIYSSPIAGNPLACLPRIHMYKQKINTSSPLVSLSLLIRTSKVRPPTLHLDMPVNKLA